MYQCTIVRPPEKTNSASMGRLYAQIGGGQVPLNCTSKRPVCARPVARTQGKPCDGKIAVPAKRKACPPWRTSGKRGRLHHVPSLRPTFILSDMVASKKKIICSSIEQAANQNLNERWGHSDYSFTASKQQRGFDGKSKCLSRLAVSV